jgi:hypothetical protein
VKTVATAISAIGRGVVATPLIDVPLVSRVLYARELVVWMILPMMMGAVEGGAVGVLAKNAFADAVAAPRLNLAVAIISGAPALANITSFIWIWLSHGKHKIRFLFGLQIAAVILIGSIALVPISGAGLVLLTIGVAGARVCWAGVVTLRTTVWRANYPRHARASLAGRFAAIQAVMMTLTVLVLGFALNANPEAFRFVYPAAATIGLAGAWVYRRLRVRRHQALLRAELEASEPIAMANPLALRRVLMNDPSFRRYMTCMFVFGTGNVMVMAPLIVVLKDRLDMSPLGALMITSALPLLLMPPSIPTWSRLLDRVHIVRFRAIHSWAFVCSTALVLAGAVAEVPALLWLAAAAKGVAFGGGVLGWNLGHHDFAPRALASQYMAVHVTLTGLRGVIAPIIGIAIYQGLEWATPGTGVWVFAVCLAISTTGAIAFVASSTPTGGAPREGGE